MKIRHLKVKSFIMLSMAFVCIGAVGAGVISTMTEISGSRLRASVIALAEFETRGYKLTNYKVIVLEKASSFEVIFVPNIPVGEESLRGGENSNGKEIHYLISSDWKLEKITYAK